MSRKLSTCRAATLPSMAAALVARIVAVFFFFFFFCLSNSGGSIVSTCSGGGGGGMVVVVAASLSSSSFSMPSSLLAKKAAFVVRPHSLSASPHAIKSSRIPAIVIVGMKESSKGGKRGDDDDDDDDDRKTVVTEYRNVVTSVLSNFMTTMPTTTNTMPMPMKKKAMSNTKESSASTTAAAAASADDDDDDDEKEQQQQQQQDDDPLSYIDFDAPKFPKVDIKTLAQILDYELYTREWFVTGNVNPVYFSDSFKFQDPDVKVDGIKDYAKGVNKLFNQRTCRAEIISTLPNPTLGPNVITCTWRLSGNVNIGPPPGLVIKPYICYTDLTVDVNGTGLIVFQEDRFDIPGWDILLSAVFPFLIGTVLKEPAPPVNRPATDVIMPEILKKIQQQQRQGGGGGKNKSPLEGLFSLFGSGGNAGEKN